ncbi:MAG: hypothetical protein ACJ8A6_02430 [Gemmatimonadales bacterium]
MVPETPFRMKPFLVITAVTMLACRGGDLTLPSDGLPASLREVSGSGQRGTVGSQLPDPLVVQVQDGAGRPVNNVSLRFDTQVPAAKILQPEVTTDSIGKAAVLVRLGSTEGTQRFEAQLASGSELRTTFAVIAIADPPADNSGPGDGGPASGGDNGDHGNGTGDSNGQASGGDEHRGGDGGGHSHHGDDGDGGHGHDHDHHGDHGHGDNGQGKD